MPDLMGATPNTFSTVSGFQFSAVEMDELGSSEYTLINILVDETGSVSGFERELEKCIGAIVNSCQQHGRSQTFLLRVAKFSSSRGQMITEIHGFNLIDNIKDPKNDYDGQISPGGGTPLLDATLDSLETLNEQAKQMWDQAELSDMNAVFYVITDGDENDSRTASYADIKATFEKIRTEEKLESIQGFLIGVNDTEYTTELEKFKNDCGFADYISMGDVKPKKLANLAGWVSQSISSTSTALGSGGPSQPVPQPSFSL